MPRTEAELLSRARALAGWPLRLLGTPSDDDATDHRGRVGLLVERALCLPPTSGAVPDAAWIGVEVKTLPIDDDGRVLESTWVTSAPPERLADEAWRSSAVWRKLARVLFVPVQGKGASLGERRLGTAFFWSPDVEEERTLRADWEDLADLVAQGVGFAVSARRGQALQLRPKARDAHERVQTTALDGEPIVIAPQGFYLRRSFTQAIVDRAFRW